MTSDGSFFSMPLQDAVILPVANTSVEELCALLAKRLVERLTTPRLVERRIKRIELKVMESPGQGAAFGIDIETTLKMNEAAIFHA